LARDRYFFHVPFPDLAVKVKRFLGLQEFATMEKINADHDSSAALPSLTVDGRHVIDILGEPMVQVFTKNT